jgi:putative DNA primase/helicase
LTGLRSPLRDDGQPGSFAVLPDSEVDPGGFKDFANGDGGSVADLARRLGLEVGGRPRPAAAPAPAPVPATLEAFARQRHLDPERLRSLWRVAEVRHAGRPALRFPTRLEVDRLKYLDGKKPKATWAGTGGRAHCYGLSEAQRIGGEVLYLVNGEPSVWAATQAGVPAVCFCIGEDTAPAADVLAELAGSGFRRFAVVYDRDDAGRRGARRVLEALRGAELEAVALELPADLGEHGDADDLARRVGDRLGEVLAGLPELSLSTVDSEPAAADGWPARQPLPAPEAVPALPAELVPVPLRPWLVDAAERACLPLELVAVPALVVAGSLVGRACGIRPEGARDGWTVVPNLWGAIVAPPGTLKSHAIGEATAPLRPLEAEALAEHAKARDGAEAEKAALAAELARLKGRKRGDVDRDGIADVMRRQRECEVTERRLLTSDATPEKLGEILAGNPRGVLLLRDEIAGWLATFDRAGREGERALYLEAWEGLNPFTVDRIGRGSVHIPALCVSVLGGIQPGKLGSYVAEALAGGNGADGLLQRMQLLVWPDALPPYRRSERETDRPARERAFAAYRGLGGLTAADLGATLQGTGGVPCLAFDSAAQAIFRAWRDDLEDRVRGDELQQTPAFCSHVAKYRSLMPSLALLFHLIETVAGGTGGGEVPEAAARHAAAWCEYLETHARKLYRRELAADVEAARALAGKLEAGEVLDGEKVRDLHRRQWSGLRTPEAVWQALTVLERLGWVRVIDRSVPGSPSYAVTLHPELKGGAR